MRPYKWLWQEAKRKGCLGGFLGLVFFFFQTDVMPGLSRRIIGPLSSTFGSSQNTFTLIISADWFSLVY